MTYQVNFTTNDEGFTEERLEESLQRHAAAAEPPLTVRRGENDVLQLANRYTLLVTLYPAGPEPYDYLLVDFVENRGWDAGPQLEVLAAVGEELDLSVLELESRLEYEPRKWAAARSRYHAPDPERRQEMRQIELQTELEFYAGQGRPLSPSDAETLRAALADEDNAGLQAQAQAIRERKQQEVRSLASSSADSPGSRRGSFRWPFGPKPR